jgi:type IV pilus assembly protein PilX
MTMSTSSKKAQTGAALVSALTMLLILTVMGVTGMQNATLDEQMSGNTRNRNLAFQATESGLRIAEQRLAAELTTLVFDCQSGLYRESDFDCDDTKDYENNIVTAWASDQWWKAMESIDVPPLQGQDDKWPNLYENPRYLVEAMDPMPDPGSSLQAGAAVADEDIYYRITTRGTGGTGSAVVVLQSIYKP